MNVNQDKMMMSRALQLARLGRGHVSPNPMVGAVIADGAGRVIGEGWHRRYGEGHAEVNAVSSVADRALLRGATIYVTLEPCSHHGKTPPCARLLVDCGFGRVVVGCEDPNPLVAGRGIAMLREAGIDVTVGVLERECRELNRRFIHAHTAGMPWVMLKWAQTCDGRLAAAPGEPRLIVSTPLTMVLMHRERAAVDAIVVGAGTVRADDPSLTVRHAPGRRPLRVVLATGRASLPPGCRLLTDGLPTLVLNGEADDDCGAVRWRRVDTSRPERWLRWLREKESVTSVMVEGGVTVLAALRGCGAWHEARVETGG